MHANGSRGQRREPGTNRDIVDRVYAKLARALQSVRGLARTSCKTARYSCKCAGSFRVTYQQAGSIRVAAGVGPSGVSYQTQGGAPASSF